jgi:hypothetical protein
MELNSSAYERTRIIILGFITVFVEAKAFFSIQNCLLVKKFTPRAYAENLWLYLDYSANESSLKQDEYSQFHTLPVFLRSVHYYRIISSVPPM